jgi:hypothetical protein
VFAGAASLRQALTLIPRIFAWLAEVAIIASPRHMVPARLLALALVAACTPSAYAPPARLISLDSPTAPRARGTDVQAEIGRIGTVFGPDLAAGNLRARHAITDKVVVEAETGMATVENEGTVVVNAPVARSTTGVPVTHASTSRDAYTGRAGAMLQGTDGAIRGALTAGLGGGYSPVAGSWTSVDVGAAVGGAGRWIRPWFTGELGLNQPLSARPFTVSYGDVDETDQTTLAMTSNVMVRSTLGLELGPIGRAFVLGLSVTRVYADSNGQLGAQPDRDGDAFIAVAAGFRARL